MKIILIKIKMKRFNFKIFSFNLIYAYLGGLLKIILNLGHYLFQNMLKIKNIF